LADLAAAGDADSLQSKDGELLYRACTTDHHHHLICRNCGKTVEIEAERVESWADEVAREHGFTQPSHTIDIFGTCSSCQ
jgi:Fur family ferric uptake transcriptional regulator